jgi:hypothetical protein
MVQATTLRTAPPIQTVSLGVGWVAVHALDCDFACKVGERTHIPFPCRPSLLTQTTAAKQSIPQR